MKKSLRTVSVVLFSLSVFCGLLTIIGILLLPAEIATPEKYAGENISGIPYSDTPQNKGLLFTLPDSSGAFIYFDFDDILTHCYLFNENAAENAENLPYFIDYTFNITPEFLAALCDRLGGVVMTDKNGVSSLYFSASLTAFWQNVPTEEQRLQHCISFFDKIAKTGLSSEDFMFIIEETNTNLSYSVCYDWIPHIKEMFCNYVFE